MFLSSVLLICVCKLLVSGEWVPQMENEGMFEGDMVLTPDQQSSIHNGYTSVSNIWPKTIHYDWAPELANNRGILSAIADYEKYTCLRFKKRTNEKNYINFFRGGGCYSPVGLRGGKQSISLGYGCTGKGTVIHEIAHSLGIFHEQSRPDRDDYVTIMYDNISSRMAYNFRKFSDSYVTSHGTSYDFKSVMHYGAYAFSKNGKKVIVTKDPKKQHLIGNRRGFSELDIVQINRMYKCEEGPATERPNPPTQPTISTNPPPEVSGIVLRHSSGKCVAINSNNQLYLTSSNCNTKFSELNGGTLKHASSRRCVQKSGDSLRLQNECSYRFEKAFVQGDGSFSIRVSGKANICIHPKGGSSYPNEGTILLTWSGCSGRRLKFTASSS